MKSKCLYRRVLALLLVCILSLCNVSSISFAGESADEESQVVLAGLDESFGSADEQVKQEGSSDGSAADNQVSSEAAEEKPAEKTTEKAQPVTDKSDSPDSGNENEDKADEDTTSVTPDVPDQASEQINDDSTSVPDSEQETAAEQSEAVTEALTEKNLFPAQSFSGSSKEVSVYANAGEGVFPEGTSMVVKAATKAELEQVIAEEDAVDAVAVDITFFDKDGNEIQPANGNTVEITLTAKRSVEGDTHEAVTMDDNGNTETVGEATAVKSIFDAEHFTIYAIIGKDDEPALLTVNFYDQDGNLLSTQIVKNGDTLLEPEVPKEIDQKVFAGWYEDGTENPYTDFGPVDGVTKTATLDLKA